MSIAHVPSQQFLVDRVARWLEGQGWSVGEETVQAPDGSRLWRVDATHRDGRTVSVLAPTQDSAWESACRQVSRIDATDASVT